MQDNRMEFSVVSYDVGIIKWKEVGNVSMYIVVLFFENFQTFYQKMNFFTKSSNNDLLCFILAELAYITLLCTNYIYSMVYFCSTPKPLPIVHHVSISTPYHIGCGGSGPT